MSNYWNVAMNSLRRHKGWRLLVDFQTVNGGALCEENCYGEMESKKCKNDGVSGDFA